jgi:hypothetical protein
MAIGQLGKLAVVVRGQIVADLAELLVDDVEVVDEPLSGRRDRPLVLDGTGQGAVRLQEDATVVGDARPDGAAPAGLIGDRLRGGKGLRVLLQPLHAEELREDGLFEVGLWPNPPANATKRVSEGLVRSHIPLSGHGLAGPALASTWGTCG